MYSQFRTTGQWITGFYPGGYSRRGVKLTIQLHPLSRLRINEAVILLTLNAFTEWTGKTFYCFSWESYLRQSAM